MALPHFWIRATSVLVPRSDRTDWIEEWDAELAATGGGTRCGGS